ncbi:hypothetical protein D3C72_1059830 [compost metagenome]
MAAAMPGSGLAGTSKTAFFRGACWAVGRVSRVVSVSGAGIASVFLIARERSRNAAQAGSSGFATLLTLPMAGVPPTTAATTSAAIEELVRALKGT